MTIYVLIMVMSMSGNGNAGVAINSQEFSSRKACIEAAATAIKFGEIQNGGTKHGAAIRLDAMCVEK